MTPLTTQARPLPPWPYSVMVPTRATLAVVIFMVAMVGRLLMSASLEYAWNGLDQARLRAAG